MQLSWGRAKERFGADACFVVFLFILTALATWHRDHYDNWTSRHDVLTQIIPWYGYLGERLRQFQIPAWNPYLNSGAPFTGDPQSGWMLFQAMAAFTLFGNAVNALKAMVGMELLIGGVATYAFARALRLSAPSAAIAAVIFEFGPLLYHTTTCCQVRGQMSPWIPVAFAGVECGLAAGSWRTRILPICLAGFGISQWYSSFLGQGALDGLLLIGAYVAYRGFVNPPDRARGWRDRLITGTAVGVGSLVMSGLLGAAGLLPRAVFVPRTEVGSGYSGITDIMREHLKSVRQLLFILLSDRPADRHLSIGGIAILLFIFGVALSWKRFCVPFFAIFTVISLAMAFGDTPLHQLFYLIPRFKDLHQHYPEQETTILMIGPSIVAAAGFEALLGLRLSWRRLGLLFAPLAVISGVYLYELSQGEHRTGITSFVGALLATLVIVFIVASNAKPAWARFGRLAPAVLVALAFILPTGIQMLIPMTSLSPGSDWKTDISVDRKGSAAVQKTIQTTAPGAAGGFLQNELKTSGPFRYVGYAGFRYGKVYSKADYMYTTKRVDSNILGVLVNGQSVFLDLYYTSAYNPTQLLRYVTFIRAMDGLELDYHVSALNETGIDSKLLRLLNVRYILLDRSIPASRSDVIALKTGREIVFRDKYAVALQSTGPQPTPAWIVHDVQTLPTDVVLKAMMGPNFDPSTAAIVEAPLTSVQPAAPGAVESATVTSYKPESMSLNVVAGSAGLLVLSEVYEPDWHAYVDGRRVDILPTDYAFRGIPITAGTHRVELRYEPASLRDGLLISGAAFAFWLLFGIWRLWSRLARLSVRPAA